MGGGAGMGRRRGRGWGSGTFVTSGDEKDGSVHRKQRPYPTHEKVGVK